jgi:hypothetical protein
MAEPSSLTVVMTSMPVKVASQATRNSVKNQRGKNALDFILASSRIKTRPENGISLF